MEIRVYIADDHAVVRDGLRALFEDFPEIQVVGDAASGPKAVSEVKEIQPDVVLMDISLPELNGIDATRQILEAPSRARVIILSMLGTPEHVFQALQAGARGYLLKESAGREVVEAIFAVSEGKIYLSQPITATLIADYLQQRDHAVENNPLDRLSQREREILPLVLDGKSSAEIGELLHLSPKTVESYRSRMMHKLGVDDLPGLMKFAMHAGLIT